MAEYIEREKMLEDLRLQFCKGCINYSEIKCKSCSVDDVIGFIEDLPTADVVEVVRCEKCLFYEKAEYYHPTDNNPTKNVCRLLKRQMQPDDYCSYGERRCEE